MARRGVRLLRRGGGRRAGPAVVPAARARRAPRHARHRVLPRAPLPRLRRRLLRGRLPARPAARAGWAARGSTRRCATTRSPTATAGRRRRSSAPRWTPPRRSPLGDLWRRYRRGSVGRRARAVARVRLVARRRAAVPQHVVDRRRGRGAVRGDEQLDGVHARRRGSRPPRARRARAARSRSIRATSAGSNSSTPSMRSTCGTRLSANSVSAATSRGGREALAVQVGGGELGALEERHRRAVVGGDVAPASAASPGARPARPPSRRRRGRARGRRRRGRRATCAPSSRSAAANSAISSWPGSWPPNVAAASAASTRVSAVRASTARARAGRASTVRKPERPGGLRSVGNQPEPKLTASSWSRRRRAPRRSRRARGSGAARRAGAAASPRRPGSPPSTIRTWRAARGDPGARGADLVGQGHGWEYRRMPLDDRARVLRAPNLIHVATVLPRRAALRPVWCRGGRRIAFFTQRSRKARNLRSTRGSRSPRFARQPVLDGQVRGRVAETSRAPRRWRSSTGADYTGARSRCAPASSTSSRPTRSSTWTCRSRRSRLADRPAR